MRKIILSAAVAISFFQAQAQISVAPEVGLNLANMKSEINGQQNPFDLKMKPGLKAGAVVHIPVAKGFFVQPGIFFSMKGTKTEYSESFMGQTASYKGSYKLNYLEIPVNLGYEYAIGKAGSVFVTAGPYLGYALSGKTVTETSLNGSSIGTTDEKIKFGSDENEDDMKAMDFGLNFSAGYKLPMGLFIRAQYGLGLANLSNVDNTTLKNNVLSFSLGYAFGL